MTTTTPPVHPASASPATQLSLSSLGWHAPESRSAPGRSSAELTSSAAWTVSRAWSTAGALDARPLDNGVSRIVVGVDGAASVRLDHHDALRLEPRQLLLVDGRTPVSTESNDVWARYEWHLRSPALRQNRFAAAFSRPLTLKGGGYALIATMTNVISTHGDLGTSGGAGALLDALSGVVMSAVLDATSDTTALSPTQARLIQEAYAIVETRFPDSSFDVTALAEALHVSARYLRRLFAIAGTSPRAAIEERRVRAAEALLTVTPARSKDTLGNIARTAGFSSVPRLQAALRRGEHIADPARST
ncbi:AraC-like DNA-binding protein [Microbacterium resistens]|uniref:AraC-like DNA-binding protein n=1 Tax=Microbacterium resistens TaxID=156977 RepID=A0ABU1SE66_9MICO|nr:helix-turn-helix domain-containing protein [Microbacterium resistens]MDR6867891.1 AraC-like DNA-binding protein [Microbacterium resistens]